MFILLGQALFALEGGRSPGARPTRQTDCQQHGDYLRFVDFNPHSADGTVFCGAIGLIIV